MNHYEEKGKDINFKHWLSRTILTAFLLLLIVGIVERYFKLELLVTALLAMTIAILFGLLHEYLHYHKAIKLGYLPVWYRTKIKFGFDIDSNIKTLEQMDKDSLLSPRELKEKNVKDVLLIGRAPYKTILPLSIITLFIGLTINNWGIVLGGFATLFMHGVTYWKEGKEI